MTVFFKHFSRICIFFSFFCLFSCNLISEAQQNNKSSDAMTLGIKLTANTPQPEKYFNDLIHPCVRYNSKGFAGHKWWLIATPYRGGDASIENPILYYGDSESNDNPPLTWHYTSIIEETQTTGYNSDPALYFSSSDTLWVFWRECYTPDCIKNNSTRITFGKYTLDGIHFSDKKIFATEKSPTEDQEMCPIIIKVNDSIRLYAAYHEFSPERIPHGLAIWKLDKNKLLNNEFSLSKNVQPEYKNNFDFWHFDIFEYKGIYYCVVSPESGDEVLLGRSEDGENFTFWDKPLITSKGTGRSYFYKPSAMIHNGIFYLWCPVAEKKISPRTSRIWMSRINFEELLHTLAE